MTTSNPEETPVRAHRQSSRRAKVAVTLPNPLLARAREQVRTHAAPSLSALVAQALEEKLERDHLQEVLDQMAADDSPLTLEELAWADRILEG